PFVMGYDTRPLLTLDERARIFTEAAEKDYRLFLEHDAYNEVCTLQMTEKGPRLADSGRLDHFFK
ncbi:MAG: MBL fold metallo-hydrolase, partial [Flavobacteriales bacterium]|nr:MBL fold metallo-hydrolase [Flavobacteriales bacterium]